MMILGDVSLLTLLPMGLVPDHSWFSLMPHDLTESITFLAQNAAEIKKIDIIGDFQKSFKNFIESGQVWALGIGVVLGWLAHSFLGS
ncbi:MAG: hypothetical protein ACKN9E_14765 [Microcystaceae cyanobacterium]